MVQLATVTPRGGKEGTTVVMLGSGFGVTPGTITLDPLSEHGGPYVVTSITLWQDDRVEYTTPSGYSLPDRDNRFYRVHVESVVGSQAVTHPWWVPGAALVLGPPPSAGGLDYQWPGFEADSVAQDLDDPRKWQAADFNRLLDTTLAQAALIQSLVGTGTGSVVRPYASGVSLRDVVYLRSDSVVDKASSATVITGIPEGIVEAIDSPVPGQAVVRYSGDLAGFVGLVPGSIYLAGIAPGSIVEETDESNTNHPAFPPFSGHILQEVGKAALATVLRVDTNRDFLEI